MVRLFLLLWLVVFSGIERAVFYFDFFSILFHLWGQPYRYSVACSSRLVWQNYMHFLHALAYSKYLLFQGKAIFAVLSLLGSPI